MILFSDEYLQRMLSKARENGRSLGTIRECEALLGIPFEGRAESTDAAQIFTNLNKGWRFSDALSKVIADPSLRKRLIKKEEERSSQEFEERLKSDYVHHTPIVGLDGSVRRVRI